jgi:hypothetical protein
MWWPGGGEQAAGIAECTELESIAELVMAATAGSLKKSLV